MGLAYYNEHDPYAAQWLRNLIDAGHIAPGVVDERSISDVVPSDLFGFTQCHFFAGIGIWSYALRLAGVSDDTEVWSMSCPCQPFSAAGISAGFADPRHLWPHAAWLIAQCQPAVVFGEQVASKSAEPWIDLVQAHMETMDYAFGCVAFPSSGVGSPHIRDRVYWVGYANNPRPQGHGYLETPHRGLGHGIWESHRPARPASRIVRLADRDRQPQGSTGDGAGVGEPGRRGEAGGLANLHCYRCDQGRGCKPTARDDGTERDSTTCWLANPNYERDNRPEQCGAGGLAEHPDDGATVGLANTQCGYPAIAPWQRPGSREADRAGSPGEPQGRGEVHDSRPAGPVNGFWRDADWLFCRDGKWRPVRPGTFPLVDGAASRVGRLRAYGNSLSADQAAIFIETALSVPRCVFSDL